MIPGVPGRPGTLSTGTILALAGAVGPEHAALILVLRYSGLVWHQAVALTRRNCDPAGTWVEVYNVAIEAPSGVIFKPARRGYSSLCDVEAPASGALARHLAALKGGRNALLFTDHRGEPLRRAWFDTHVWGPALDSVGVDPAISLEDLAVERLRASWADKALTKRRYQSLEDPGGRTA